MRVRKCDAIINCLENRKSRTVKQERLKFSGGRKEVCESFGRLAEDHGVRCNLIGGFNDFTRFTGTCP